MTARRSSTISPRATESPLMTTLRRFERAHRTGSVERMRACLHDDAIIESIASGRRPLGPDETVEALRSALRDGVYHIGGWQYEPLGDDLVIVTTSVRQRSASGGFSHDTVFRATIGRDTLMFRVKLFDNRADARHFLERYAAAAARGARLRRRRPGLRA